MDKPFVLTVLALLSAGIVNAKAEDVLYPDRIDLTGKLGSERSLGELDIMWLMKQDPDRILYIDFRGQADDKETQEFNLGIGVREIVDTKLFGETIVGSYAFFDARRSKNNNLFYQTTIGFESLSEKLDLRGNFYIPINEEKQIDVKDSKLVNSEAGVRVSYSDTEKAMYGMDAEVGTGFTLDDSTFLRLYAGIYHFDNSKVDDITGVRVRSEFLVDFDFFEYKNTTFTLGYEWQNDKVRGRQSFFSARLSIPFGANSSNQLKGVQKRMLTPIVRDIDIVTNEAVTTEDVFFDNGERISYFYDDVDTEEKLYQSVTVGNKNSLVVVSDDVDIENTVILSAGQKIFGGQRQVKLRTAEGKNIYFKTNGKENPVIENKNSDPVFVLAGVSNARNANNASEVELVGIETKSGIKTNHVVLPTYAKLDFNSNVSISTVLGNIKALNLGSEELQYSIFILNPNFDDNQPVGPTNEQYLDDVVTVDRYTGSIKAGTNISSAPDLVEGFIKTIDASGKEHETYLHMANEHIRNEDYTPILPGVYYTNGVTINYGSDLNNADVNASGKTKIEYVVDLINKLLEKDKSGDRSIIKALERNKPHLVNFNNLTDVESRQGAAYLYAVPNSQDLQADEIFPNANKNAGQDTVSSARDASLEEIVHLIHNYGITYAYPDLQRRLNTLTEAALNAGKLDWAQGNELPRSDLDDEYFAECVEVFYNRKAGAGFVKAGVGLDPGSNRNDLKAFDPAMHDLIAEIFPDSLDLGY